MSSTAPLRRPTLTSGPVVVALLHQRWTRKEPVECRRGREVFEPFRSASVGAQRGQMFGYRGPLIRREVRVQPLQHLLERTAGTGATRSSATSASNPAAPVGGIFLDLWGQSLERSPWKDPLMLGTTNFVQPGEVLVVMQHDQVRVPRRSRDHKVRNRYPMLTADRERMLQGDCGLHHLRSDWRRIKTTAAYAHPLVVGQASRAVEHFQIDHCTRRDIAFLQERKDTFGNLGHGKARQHALVCQECSLQRQAPAITFGSFKSRPSMDASWAA